MTQTTWPKLDNLQQKPRILQTHSTTLMSNVQGFSYYNALSFPSQPHTHTHLHGQRSEGCCFTLFHAILSRAVSQYELTRAPKLRSVWSRAHSTKQGATFRSIHTSSLYLSRSLFISTRFSFSSHKKKISSRRGKQMFSPSLTPKSRFPIVAAAAAVTNTRE